MKTSGSETRPEEADFIVIGGGSAGCAVAARLSEYSDAQVLLLEAGDDVSHPLIRMPLAWMQLLALPQFGWGTMSEPEPHMDGRVQPLPRGRILGGSSEINGTMYIRGMAADYDAWRDAGLTGWGFEDVLPYFRRAEDSWRGASHYHGVGGPVRVTPMQRHPELYPAFVDAARSMGWQEIEDFNVAAPEGFSLPDCTIRDGRRHSARNAYLDPARSRHNLRIEAGCLVRRILVAGGRATGVEIERDGQIRLLRARREVVLCAGAFNSPQLLLLSGIGPGAQLQQHGIQTVVDLPGVGRNLQDHAIALSFWVPARPNTFERELRADRLAFNVARWWLTGRGTPAQSPLTIQGFIRSDATKERPDLQFQASHVSYAARPWFPGWRKGAGHQISAGTLLLNPESRGQVSLRDGDARTPPRILLNFLEAESDRRALRNAMRLMRRFFDSGPARQYVLQEVAPGPAAESDEQLDAWLRATVISGAHPTSTCAMGSGPAAVVDARLRVRGVEGLRVADCSVMPDIIRGNTNAPAMMIGEKAADLLLDRVPRR